MDRLKFRDFQCINAFLRAIYALRDPESFPREVITGLAGLFTSDDLVHFTELDPTMQTPGVTMITPDISWTSEMTRFWLEHAGEHPLVAHFMKTFDGGAKKTSDFISNRHWRHLELYNNIYRQWKIENVMSVEWSISRRNVVGLSVKRMGFKDFTEHDRSLLDALRPHIHQAHMNIKAIINMETMLKADGQEIITLAPDGRMKASAKTRQLFVEYFGPHHVGADRLPEELRRWIQSQRLLLSRNDDGPSTLKPLVVELDGKRLVIRLFPGLFDDEGHLLLQEEHTALTPSSLVSHGLSKRESEILFWVAFGKTNKEIGSILALSPRTAQKHLEHIYIKLGVENRTAAATRAFELIRKTIPEPDRNTLDSSDSSTPPNTGPPRKT